MDDQITHFKRDFEMRNGKIEAVHDAAERFGQRQRDWRPGIGRPNKMLATTTKQIVELDDGAAKTSEPSSAIATTTPSMNQCMNAA